MKALLLGAGASKAYGQSPTGQRPPVARDFFQTYGELDIAANPWVLIEGLCGYLLECRHIADPHSFLISGIDIEALHSEIEQARDELMSESQDYIDFYYEFRAYNELVFLFSSVINEVQNGPASTAHLALARSLTPEDVVITFNWDTLMDRALAESTSWRPDWGYGAVPRHVFRDGWVGPVPCPQTNDAPALIKLHGSTNWLTGHPTRDTETNAFLHTHALEPDAFGVFEFATKPYDCFAGRYMEGYQPYSYGYYPPNLDFEGRQVAPRRVLVRARPRVPWKPEGTAGDAGLVSIPLIIPPVRHKTYNQFGSLFGQLWNSAESALSQADHIIVIGYSFPETDIQSDTLFKTAFSGRSTMPHITIMDPNPQHIADRFRQSFGIDDDHLHVVAERFGDSFDLNRFGP